jgi:hypothetical protein
LARQWWPHRMRTDHQFAIGDITPTIHILAPLMAITGLSGLRADSSSAQVPGITGGGVAAGAMAVAGATVAGTVIAADMAAFIRDTDSTEATVVAVIRVDTRSPMPADLLAGTAEDSAAVAATVVVAVMAAVVTGRV